MELEFSPEQREFRSRVRAWLRENRPTARFDPPDTEHGFAQHMQWEKRLFHAGYAAPGWPAEVGGLGLDLWAQLIYEEEYARLGLPERLNKMGLLHGGPTVLAHGTEQQQRDWLPGILDCSEIWCQGFSEPGAGSDLASLRTTGTITGDEIILNGQKTWTSAGPIATKMFALVRTDPAAARHHGISFVVFDLRRPGVEVRPLRQLHGHSGFAEVFLTDVRIPATSVVGPVNDGWRIAQTSLRLERGVGRGVHTKLAQALRGLAEAVQDAGADTGALQRLGSLRAWTFAYEQATYALTDTLARGGADEVMPSILKLRLSEIQTAIWEERLAMLGEEAETVDELGPGGELPPRHREYWHSRANEIFAGTNEIQKNIIGEQGLGLPREPRR
ncbi:MAG TPA: acyl-CoA dehydrogenase family protein [Amycolatopsis sp.]|nr:acyl-CoA dehydrogenase family protein [Amycolatopsis sp.]